MGDVLGGIFGGGSRTTQETKPDEISRQLNLLRLQQLNNLFGVSSYGSFAGERPDIYTGAPAVDELFRTASTPVSPVDYSNLMGLEDYKKLGLDASRGYISQIATPQILSTAVLQGLEGGGFVPEALAKASAEVGLPFVQSLPGASATLFGAPQQAELARSQRQLLGAQSAGSLFPLADYGRALREEDLLRTQGVVTTGLTGIPFTPGSTSKQRQSTQPLFNFFGQG